ncbi:MAG: hypothetical protein KDL87_06300 [Verrucomicrobiae bacterium]|nr:hypothetical protein [Verrucomicrobiae bacterium]
MVVSLAIIAVLSGYFMIRFSESREEELLKPPATKLRLMSQKAMRQATAYREDFTIVFTQAEIALLRGHGLPQGWEGDQILESISVPSGIDLQLRLLGDDKWFPANGDPWFFRPAGLCEPIEVRFTSGNSFIELTFDPLTARAEESSYYP